MNIQNINIPANVIIIFLIVIGMAGIGGVAYYGLKEKSSSQKTVQSSDQAEISNTPDMDSKIPQETFTSSADKEIVWPSDKMLEAAMPESGSETLPSSMSPTAQSGNPILDAYLRAYQEAQQNQDFYKETSFQATAFQSLPLKYFLDALNIRIHPAVSEYLDRMNYLAVFCYYDANRTDKGFIFGTKAGSDEYYTQLFSQIRVVLRVWEPTMFVDLKSAFFPQSDFAVNPIFQEIVHYDKYDFMNLTRSQANLRDTTGKNYFIAYTFFGERVYIANSKECLQRMTDKYSPEPG